MAFRLPAEKFSHAGPRSMLICFLVSVIGCSGGERQIVGPGTDPGGPSSPSLDVRVMPDPTDAALAEALGWDAGVPNAEVHLLRNGTAIWQVRTTDSDGTVFFDDVGFGVYRLYASRALTAAEQTAAGQPARGFGDGRTLLIGGPTEVSLNVLADRTGGLVISEINRSTPPPWETGGSGYNGGLYFEVYNDSDQTLYLDGLVFGSTIHTAFRDYDHWPCVQSEPVRTDESGLYVRSALQFPGSGTDHPIQPGEALVVAQSAIDHTPVHAELFDLRDAAFEIGGVGIADNPAVPNMQSIGLEAWFPQFLYASGNVFFLARSFDPQSLPIEYRGSTGRGYVRVPADLVIESVAFSRLWPDNDLESPPCRPMLPPRFDRYEGGFFEIGLGVESPTESLQRRRIRSENGRTVLLNTSTSAVDFVLAPPTPGWVP